MLKKLLALTLTLLMIAGVMIIPGVSTMADVGDNIAPNAEVSVSYVPSWNNKDKINDGAAPSGPCGTSTCPVGECWATWTGSYNATEWAAYTWAQEVAVDKIAVYWDYDQVAGDSTPGVRIPSAVKLYYMDSTGNYVQVEDFAIGTELDVYNEAEFAPVFTTSLKIELTTDTDALAVGMREWQVFEAAVNLSDAESVAKDAAKVAVSDLDLAGYATANLNLKTVGNYGSTITWSSSNAAVIAADGTVTRPADNTVVTLTATVTKGDAVETKTFEVPVLKAGIDGVVMSVNDVTPISTQLGTAATLPATVNANLSNGKKADVAVTWDVTPANYYETAGDYTFTGTVANAVDGANASVTVSVIGYYVSSVNTVEITVEDITNIPALPTTVTVKIAKGALPDEQRAVTWLTAPDVATLENAGQQTIYGTVEGTDIQAVAVLSTKVTAEVVDFTKVKVNSNFWFNLIKKDIVTTIPHCVQQVTNAGWGNIVNVAKKHRGESYSTSRQGTMVFQDSDVHKTLEAMAIALQVDPQGDEQIIAGQEWIKTKLDEWVPEIVDAQIHDPSDKDYGYLNAWYELACESGGYRRWSNYSDHELYVAGHFIESAINHYRAFEGQDTRLYDCAIRLADYLCNKFETLNEVPGHEEIELALAKLGNLRNEIMKDGSGDRYISMAKIFINRRGNTSGRPSGYRGGTYSQDNTTIQKATEAVGHSVRFGYFVMAVTDIAIAEGDPEYIASLSKLWTSCVDTKMYITGATGVSAGGDSEGFGGAYSLADNNAYAESCAAISNMKWAQRMNRLFGDSEYADVMERVLYNGFLHSLGVNGNTYFYTNTLQGSSSRSSWFSCACCPPNIARIIASVGEYAYVVKGKELRANAYMGSVTNLDILGKHFTINQITDYPYDGAIKFEITTATPDQAMALKLRIPEWFNNAGACNFTVALNGQQITNPVMEQGYVLIDRSWSTGDYVELNLDVKPVRYYEDEQVTFATGKVAITYGPLVMSFESNDNTGSSATTIANYMLPKEATLSSEDTTISNLGRLIKVSAAGALNNNGQSTTMVAIPYYLTHNRGGGIVTHVLEEEIKSSVDTIATRAKVSATYTSSWEDITAVNDGITPLNSTDRTAHPSSKVWGTWNHSATTETITYTFDQTYDIWATGAYWFTDNGGLRYPTSWYAEYQDVNGNWNPVTLKDGSSYGVAGNRYNTAEFETVTAKGLRLVITKSSSGWIAMTQWTVDGQVAGADSVDKSALKALVEQAQALDASEYTSTTWAAVEYATTVGANALDSTILTQAQIDKIADDLQKALDALVKEGEVVDKSELVAAINTATAIDTALYTEESVTAFNAVLIQAQAINNQGTATQAQVNAAVKSLNDAMAALVKIETPDEPDEPTVDYEIISVNGKAYEAGMQVAKDENITVVFRTPATDVKLGLFNEVMKGITKTASCVSDGECTEWTFTFITGTKGARTFNLSAKKADEADWRSTGAQLVLQIGEPAPEKPEDPDQPVVDEPVAPAIISASADVEEAKVNETFTVNVLTSTGVEKVGLFNENGSGISKKLVSATVVGDQILWVYDISVASKGNRTLTAKGYADGAYLEDGVNFNIVIKK